MDISEMSDALDSSTSRVIGHEVKHSTRWLEFRHLRYLDPTGKERGWDMVGRTTGTCAASVSATRMPDAVCVFTTLRQVGREDSTLLVRQFRPPLQAETIELPAGLVDIDDESPVTTALRELHEETGYVGTASGTVTATPTLPLSPGLTDETVTLVRVDVDLDAPENQQPRQRLEGSEFITVLRVPVRGLRGTLDTLVARGYHIFAGLYTMALGMEMAEAAQ